MRSEGLGPSPGLRSKVGSRRRKWLRWPPEGAGRRAGSHSTLPGWWLLFRFFLAGLLAGKSANQTSSLPSATEPPKSRRYCSRVRSSRLSPLPAPRCVDPRLGLPGLLPARRPGAVRLAELRRGEAARLVSPGRPESAAGAARAGLLAAGLAFGSGTGVAGRGGPVWATTNAFTPLRLSPSSQTPPARRAQW